MASKQSDRSTEIVEIPPETPAASPQGGKRKRLLIGGATAAMLIAAAGGAYFWMSPEGKETGAHSAAEGGARLTFVDVPPMMVNLRSADGTARFLKLHFMLIPGPKGDPERLRENLPLLLDAYQSFLRELRPEDLSGSAAVFRIKEQMLVRAHETLGEGQVEDVLIQDLVQQ